ncbi:DUF928 domain-containing protein [Microcoleus sp. FACHB-53]|nr:DUF928 domain-containing protein [Microcoleus sp. FACHB-53]MBD2128988.1 DUF928 domain-containing protein [Microcoleus sp. FACHB-1]
MAWFTHTSRFTLLALALTLGTPFPISAQPTNSSSLGSQLESSFRVPSRGLPDNRQGGASRGPCFTDERKLTALVPVAGGETTAEYPTVFWYMPRMSALAKGDQGAAPAPELEFTLRDANEQKIYSAKYPLPKSNDGSVGTPGIMSLRLASPYSLKVGQEYKWQLRVMCDAQDPSGGETQIAEGIIKRVAQDPDLERRVQQAAPEERIILYAKANRWYEMLANLVALRRNRPNDPSVTDAWNKLFAVVNLNDVSIQSRSQGTRNTNN